MAPGSQTERELVQDSVKTVGQIFSNYQAALHLFEEAVTGFGESVPRPLALEVLQQAAREVFVPVLDACAGVAPGLDDLVTESIGSADAVPAVEAEAAGPSAQALRDLVIAERQRVAATHSRLIRRQAALMKVGEERAGGGDYRAALVAAARRLDELETGSHSAGALFTVLFERWKDLLRGRMQ
jgi:hypothetical protein